MKNRLKWTRTEQVDINTDDQGRRSVSKLVRVQDPGFLKEFFRTAQSLPTFYSPPFPSSPFLSSILPFPPSHFPSPPFSNCLWCYKKCASGDSDFEEFRMCVSIKINHFSSYFTSVQYVNFCEGPDPWTLAGSTPMLTREKNVKQKR